MRQPRPWFDPVIGVGEDGLPGRRGILVGRPEMAKVNSPTRRPVAGPMACTPPRPGLNPLPPGLPMTEPENLNRRTFLSVSAVAGLSATALGVSPPRPIGAQRPVVIASGNGLRAVEKAMALIRAGADPLDAAIEGVAIVEADPKDH